MRNEYDLYYESPLGILKITGSEEAVTGVNFMDKADKDSNNVPECLFECRRQLDEYFKGKRREFKLKTELRGTEFQKKVLKELYKVPFGRTVSYGE
ncbi:MAG: cysteine methyltransferase, partial [Candidatus Aminicenantes bacterium]|nr:cysteine methyltransferase [Candidatus Aminicenantes bacterium]